FGDIEYQLVFYRGGTNLGNTLYASQWYPVRIEPGRTSSVEWSPTFGSSTVEVSIQHPPPPPEDLAAEWTENGLLLTWAAPDVPDAAGYNVWRKTGPLTPLERLAQVEGGHVTSWLHKPPRPSSARRLATTACSTSSPRSAKRAWRACGARRSTPARSCKPGGRAASARARPRQQPEQRCGRGRARQRGREIDGVVVEGAPAAPGLRAHAARAAEVHGPPGLGAARGAAEPDLHRRAEDAAGRHAQKTAGRGRDRQRKRRGRRGAERLAEGGRRGPRETDQDGAGQAGPRAWGRHRARLPGRGRPPRRDDDGRPFGQNAQLRGPRVG